MVIGGAVVVLVVLVWRLGGALSSGAAAAEAGSIDSALGRIEQHNRLRDLVKAEAESLGIEIPDVAGGEQETKIRKDLAQRAGKFGLGLSSVRRIEVGSTRRRKRSPAIEFRLELGGKFDKFMEFVHALENAPIPYVLSEAKIDTTAKGGNQGGGQNRKGDVRVSLKVKSYLFPNVKLTEKAEEKPPAAAPTPQASAEGTPVAEESVPEEAPASEDVKPQTTPAQTSTPTPAPTQAPRSGRKVIKFNGQIMGYLEGTTFTSVDGQTREVSQEELDQITGSLPDGMEIVDE